MNYKEVYDYGVSQLAQAGIEENKLDARLLLEHVCHTDRNDLLVHGDREVPAREQNLYREYIGKRKMHIPLQHITGEQEFMGLVFRINNHVLIPRQDTEILVEEVLRHLHDGMKILDMCTGSGCILLSLLHYSNGCTGVGTDISQEALTVAKENGAKLMEQDGTEKESEGAVFRFVKSDLFENVEGKYDVIVSNPPYIPTGVIPSLMEEVRNYEPREALDGKEDGLFFYRRISSDARGFLKGGGYLFFEIGYDQAKEVSHIMESDGYRDVTVVKDFAGLDRVVYGWSGRAGLCNDMGKGRP